MMRIIPFEIELDYWKMGSKNLHTFRIAILHFDWSDDDASLFEFGWYQGRFVWDFMFINWLLRKGE